MPERFSAVTLQVFCGYLIAIRTSKKIKPTIAVSMIEPMKFKIISIRVHSYFFLFNKAVTPTNKKKQKPKTKNFKIKLPIASQNIKSIIKFSRKTDQNFWFEAANIITAYPAKLSALLIAAVATPYPTVSALTTASTAMLPVVVSVLFLESVYPSYPK